MATLVAGPADGHMSRSIPAAKGAQIRNVQPPLCAVAPITSALGLGACAPTGAATRAAAVIPRLPESQPPSDQIPRLPIKRQIELGGDRIIPRGATMSHREVF